MKKAISLLLLLCFAAALFSGCAFGNVRMPFNGKIEFHDITAVIPSDFIRDSTQSKDDLWVFEKGGYKKIIIISRSDIKTDADTHLKNYVNNITAKGGTASQGKYLYEDAAMSTYYIDGVFCQEIIFAYNGSLYAFARRGGTESEFNELLKDINTPDTVSE